MEGISFAIRLFTTTDLSAFVHLKPARKLRVKANNAEKGLERTHRDHRLGRSADPNRISK
jgi:hypothetical protein